MLNHFRTILANLKDQGTPDDFLCPDFTPINLPKPLSNFYKLLYQDSTSRSSQLQLTTCIERLLTATRQDSIVTSYDSRKTYDVDLLTKDFQIFQVSTPVTNTSDYSLLFSGVMENPNRTTSTYKIQQYNQTLNVSIFSVDDNTFVRGKEVIASVNQALIPVTFTGNLSQPIQVGNTDLYFRITGDSTSFTDVGNKYWNFAVTTPAEQDLLKIYTRLKSNDRLVSDMLNYGANNQTSLNYWNQHFNPLFKLSGLLNLYVSKVHNVWQTQT